MGRRWSAVGGGSSRYVNAPWIRTGSLPSGYPAATENKLSSLLETHALTEKMAFAELEGFVTPIASDLSPVSRPSRAVSPKRHQFDAMPEISGKQIYRALTGRGLDAVPQEFAWSFPKGYLADALACHPAAAVVVALGKPAKGVSPSQRVVADTSARLPIPGQSFVLVDPDGRTTVWTIDKRDRSPEIPRGWIVVGRACGAVLRFDDIPSKPRY